MRLLVIENYEPVREALAQGLREAGFAVDASADGNVGLSYATSNAYDAIVLDLMLPGVDGLTLLKRLREAGGNAHVLILSARDSTEDRITGLDLGADDYMVKPFAFRELLARVRALVRRRHKAKGPGILIGDLEIDTDTRTVYRAGKRIDLTPKEYVLLNFLAMRTGELVTRGEIWEQAFEYNSEAESNVVDVTIGHIRRKLDGPGLAKLIHTRRGHGYVLGAMLQ